MLYGQAICDRRSRRRKALLCKKARGLDGKHVVSSKAVPELMVVVVTHVGLNRQVKIRLLVP